MGKLVFVFGLSLIGSNLSAQSQTPLDAGQLLYEAFGSKCRAQGPFSARALEETRALEGILIQIKEDPACVGVVGLLQALVAAEDQFAFLQGGLKGEERSQLEALEQRLVIALALALDPLEQNLLKAELASVRMQLHRYPFHEAEARRFQRAQATSQLVRYIEAASSAYPELLLCFHRYPSVPVQMASQLLSISGGFFDPTVNLAVSLAGRLLATFLDYVANAKINRQISDYRRTTMRAGLSCAMEALEQTYCDTEDHHRLVSVLMDFRLQDEVPKAWRGYNLLQNDYPVVQRFLEVAEAGAETTTEDQANRRASFFQKQGNNRAIEQQVVGIFAETQRDLPFLNPQDQEQRLNQMVVRVASLMTQGGSVGSGGFVDVIPNGHQGAQLWLRLGDPSPALQTFSSLWELVESLNTAGSPYRDIDAVIRRDLSTIRENFQEIARAARVRIDLEQTQTINTDKQGALATWTRETQTRQDAGVVIEELIDYLMSLERLWEDEPEWFSSPHAQRDQVAVVRDTRKRFENTLEALYTDELSDEEKLSVIYQEMQLIDRDQFITNRLREIVEQDLVKQLRAGFLRDDDEVLDSLVRLSTDSLIRRLAISGSTNERLPGILRDLGSARLTALENIANFYDHYIDRISKTLDYLNETIQIYQIPESDPVYEEFARLCVLALNNPRLFVSDRRNAPSTKIVEACRGKSLMATWGPGQGEVFSDIYGQPIKACFDTMSKKPPLERMCAYRRYQNQLELYEILQHRLEPFFESESFEWLSASSIFGRFMLNATLGSSSGHERSSQPEVKSDWVFDNETKAWRRVGF